MSEYNLNCEAGSLGDMVAATALFKNGRFGSVTVTDEVKIRNFAQVFKNIAEVRFVPGVKEAMPLAGLGCTSRRLLNALNINDFAVPRVQPSNEDIDWAIQWIRDNNIKQPVVINGTVGGVNASDHPLRFYRKIDEGAMQEIVDDLNAVGFNPLSFGTSSNQVKLNGVLATPDLPINRLMGLYYTIRRYIGCDTGDYHLMLACGGNCFTLVPDDAWNYRYAFHHYQPTDFPTRGGLPPNDPRNSRVKYINFKDYKNMFKKKESGLTGPQG